MKMVKNAETLTLQEFKTLKIIILQNLADENGSFAEELIFRADRFLTTPMYHTVKRLLMTYYLSTDKNDLLKKLNKKLKELN